MKYDRLYFVNYQWYRPGGESLFYCGWFNFKEIKNNQDIIDFANYLNYEYEYFKNLLKENEKICIMNFVEII